MNKVRIGVVGLGRLGQLHADNIVNKIKNAQLSAVCSVQEDELYHAKKQWGVDQCNADYNEMLSQAELDAVAIISPSNLHCEQVISALEKGLHVFCEKPLSISKAECLTVEKAVLQQPKLVFMLGFMRRYDPSYTYAKNKIESGFIGRPILFRGYSVDPESAINGAIKYAAHSAGQFLDMAIHDIDLARWLLQSEPKSIYAIGGCYAHQEFSKYQDGDNVSALMQFENESMAFLLAGRTAPHGYNVETEIIGTLGHIRIGSVPQKNLVELIDGTGIRKECTYSFSERFNDAFINEMQEFVDCIREDRKPSVSAHDGTRSTIIAELATQSFKNNKLITMD